MILKFLIFDRLQRNYYKIIYLNYFETLTGALHLITIDEVSFQFLYQMFLRTSAVLEN